MNGSYHQHQTEKLKDEPKLNGAFHLSSALNIIFHIRMSACVNESAIFPFSFKGAIWVHRTIEEDGMDGNLHLEAEIG